MNSVFAQDKNHVWINEKRFELTDISSGLVRLDCVTARPTFDAGISKALDAFTKLSCSTTYTKILKALRSIDYPEIDSNENKNYDLVINNTFNYTVFFLKKDAGRCWN